MSLKVTVSTAAGQAKFSLSEENSSEDNVIIKDGAVVVISDDGLTQDWFGPGFWHHMHGAVEED